MRIFRSAIVGAGLLALAACGGAGDDTRGDNATDAADAKADALEEQADNTTNEVREDMLENKADAIRDSGEAKEEAIDEADGTNRQ